MLRILICSESDLRPALASTVIGRQRIDVFRADGLPALRLLSATLDPRVILLDRDFAGVQTLVEELRADPATRQRSIAVLARGAERPLERQLVKSGANAVLRLPPDAGWDERMSRLLTVPPRYATRLPVELDVETQPSGGGTVVNLSDAGMLLATRQTLQPQDEVSFRFRLPDGTTVAGKGRVARVAAPVGYGMQFTDLPGTGREAIGQFLRSARLG
jgi:CheY-like chemotaxis protein